MTTKKKLQNHGLVHGAWTGGEVYGDTRNILITVTRTGLVNTTCGIIMLRIQSIAREGMRSPEKSL